MRWGERNSVQEKCDRDGGGEGCVCVWGGGGGGKCFVVKHNREE